MGRSALVLSTLLLVILVDLGSNLAFLAAISLLFWGAWGGGGGEAQGPARNPGFLSVF